MPKKKIALSQAARMDKYRLYEKAVQSPETELAFIASTFKELCHRTPRILREDFCASAYLSIQWLKQHPKNQSIAIDIDGSILDWCRQKHLAKLSTTTQQRITLLQQDVIQPISLLADVTVALNFSYWIFKNRNQLKSYFEAVYQSLHADGLIILDIFGGHKAQRALKEKTKYKHFTYIWEQEPYNPITGEILCHIHFRFPDKSCIKKAFSYDWRFWHLPELLDILKEAGFAPHVYWEGEDKHTGEGSGVFTRTNQPTSNDPCWIAYVVGEKIQK